ncbi:MAG TPA: L,D-transpeptidase [Thermoanaerobaculia bacterium]|nr:L,D-transpeptidase [Thermoanaerobaculia bacterium]
MLRRILIALAIVAVLALIVAAVTPVALGWTDPPDYGRQVAERALAEARASLARDWAPELLRRAETTMRINRDAEVLESHRLLPLRDFRVIRVGYDRAEKESRLAIAEGEKRAADLEKIASDQLDRAESAIASAEEVLDAAGRQTDLRGRLARARLLYDESRLRYEDGDFPYARDRAALAEEQAIGVVKRATAMMERYVDAGEVARWQRWIDDTIRWSKRTGEPAIVVSKDDHRLTLYQSGREVHTFPADIGLNNLNGKVRAGDHATPEGRYKVTSKRNVGQTAFYKAFMLDYPNQEDRKRFDELRRKGEIPRGAGPGNLIEIHGEGGRAKDWTRGCVAVSNDHMDKLFKLVRVGTPVTIVGGRGEGGVFSGLVRSYATTEGASDDTALD